jgi:hypothetical protein
MFRSVGYLVDVAVRGSEVRPRLPGRLPLVDGPDELDALGLETPAGTLDVVHQETGDRSRGEVSVLGVGGAEDLPLLPSGSLKSANSPSSCSSGRPRASR